MRPLILLSRGAHIDDHRPRTDFKYICVLCDLRPALSLASRPVVNQRSVSIVLLNLISKNQYICGITPFGTLKSAHRPF